ncbi:MAG: FKBP-type peptidyl-prolyl cis-trans isomerase [Gammaproteobacteria bacterium]|nr:MAG: FKBP-type peptidyl-prolyl cis-trans isomerase [Gammaproteobacteria bacterium]
MISRIVLMIFTLVFVVAAGAAPLKTNKQRASYIFGYRFATDMKSRGLDFDANAVAQGIRDFNRKKKPALTNNQVKSAMQYVQKRMMARRNQVTKKLKLLAVKNMKDGKAFLAKNKKAKGVKTTSSGLQYMIIREGSGNKPKPSNEVVVHYKGTLINGKVFDSSYRREKPVTFMVGGVIKGWQEALQLMKKGGKIKVFIPSDLAYGLRGNRGIPPNSVLIFDMELIDIRKPKKS